MTASAVRLEEAARPLLEALAEAGGAADQAAQDVAAALVAGRDAVGDQEGGGARVLGDDAHCSLLAPRLPAS